MNIRRFYMKLQAHPNNISVENKPIHSQEPGNACFKHCVGFSARCTATVENSDSAQKLHCNILAAAPKRAH